MSNNQQPHQQQPQYQQYQQPQQPQFNGDDMNKAGYVTLRCPKCGSPNIEFVTEYHKDILGRFFFFLLCIATAILLYVGFISDELDISNFTWAIISGILTCITYISILIRESKTHVKGICRTCGFTWNFS